MPWKEAIPKSMMKETVKNSVMMINAFPPKSGINDYLSPCNIAIGKTLDYKTHFCSPFGDHAQVQQNEEPHNSAKEQTLGAIGLGPIDNAQGRWKFMSPETGYLIKRYSWDVIPMTQEAMNKALEHRKKENSPLWT